MGSCVVHTFLVVYAHEGLELGLNFDLGDDNFYASVYIIEV